MGTIPRVATAGVLAVVLAAAVAGCDKDRRIAGEPADPSPTIPANATEGDTQMNDDANDVRPAEKPDDQWRRELSPEQYRVLRQCGTEPPGSGKYVHHAADGTYTCAACGNELFTSDTKFESGSGWPSFFAAAGGSAVTLLEDRSMGMVRTEVRCARCGSHLGHVFDDGPQPTGRRYCINSVALDFEGEEPSDADGAESD